MSDYQSKPGTPYGFIPCKLFVKDRPEFLAFPLKIMFMSFMNHDGIDESGQAIYCPDIDSYTKHTRSETMRYYNDYGPDNYIDITHSRSNGVYHGRKYINGQEVAYTYGKTWKDFFIHLTINGISQHEGCLFSPL